MDRKADKGLLQIDGWLDGPRRLSSVARMPTSLMTFYRRQGTR